MTGLWVTLLLKSTALLALTCAAAFALRGRSAAIRHLVWLMGLSGVLVLPLGLLLPEEAATGAPMFRIGASLAPVSTAAHSGTSSFTILWLSGLVLCVVRLAFGALRARRIIQRSIVTGADEGIDIRSTSEPVGPVAWGFGQGIVLLPEHASGWSSERRTAIVLHEAAHLERKDCWALLIAELACACYWFHPLVWYAAIHMRREQEKAADDHVLRSGVDRGQYAEHLVALARSQRSQLLMAGAVTRSDLSARIEAILDSKRRRQMLTRRIVAASISALLIVTLPLAAVQAERKTYRIGGGVSTPVPLEKVEGKYSQQARDAKIEGTVVMSVIIETDGNVYDVKIERGLEQTLDDNAIAAVSKWRFKPAEKDGKPVAVAAVIEMNFRLR